MSLLNNQDVRLADLRATPLEKRLAQFDAPRSFSAVTSYDVPFGKGKRFCANMPRVLNAVAGDWNFNVQWTAHSGFPFAFPNAAPLSPQTANLHDDRRDALPQKHGRSQFDPTYGVYFNAAIFPAQAPFTLRNFPARFPDVRSKILNIWEMSLHEEFPIRERARLQIRGHFHDAFNHPWFGNLDSANVSDSQFGRLAVSAVDDTSERRLIVLVMKIVF